MTAPAVRAAVTLEQCWHRVPGGTATSVLGTVRALVARGDVDVVGLCARHAGPPPAPWAPPVPVRPSVLWRPALYDAWLWLGRPSVDGVAGPVDVVHATTLLVPPTRHPLVVTIHDLAFLHDPGQFTARGVRSFRRGLELTRRHADVVLCPSEATRRDCEEAGIEAERLRVVPWGADVVDVDAATVAAARRRHGLEEPYVLWVGTLEPRKNLPVLLDAFGRLGGTTTLALAGPDGWGPDLGPALDALGPRLRRLGFVSPLDLTPLVAGAAVVCYPSLREGFGMPVLEAMAVGTPVVTSRGTATEEVAGGAAELVEPTDPDDVARGLAAVLDDPVLAARLATAGRRRAADFTWERTAELTVDAYRAASA